MKINKQTKTKHGLARKAYKTTRSFIRNIRRLSGVKNKRNLKTGNGIKVAFIHNEKRILTGAHHINQIMADVLGERGVKVRNFYPRRQIDDAPAHMRGLANILFFHSLLEHKDDILRYRIIQAPLTLPCHSFLSRCRLSAILDQRPLVFCATRLKTRPFRQKREESGGNYAVRASFPALILKHFVRFGILPIWKNWWRREWRNASPHPNR